MKRYLIGAGGHATVIESISNKGGNVKLDGVFCDNKEDNLTHLEWIGSFDEIYNNIDGNEFMIAFGDINERIKLIEKLNNYNIKWMLSMIDKTAIVAPGVKIGEGTVVMPGAIINAGAKIGKHVIVNSGAIIEHGCVINDYCHISPSATICGNTVVGKGSWLGANSTVINALTIGEGVIVGAGTVVLKNIDDNLTIVGAPSRVLKK